MSLIGVRELREQASEVIRHVREDHAEYVVTYQGRPVAILLPLDVDRAEEQMVQAGKNAVLSAWGRYERLASEIRAAWPPEVNTQEVVDDIRR
jgi:prevent-host-death family protein